MIKNIGHTHWPIISLSAKSSRCLTVRWLAVREGLLLRLLCRQGLHLHRHPWWDSRCSRDTNIATTSSGVLWWVAAVYRDLIRFPCTYGRAQPTTCDNNHSIHTCTYVQRIKLWGLLTKHRGVSITGMEARINAGMELYTIMFHQVRTGTSSLKNPMYVHRPYLRLCTIQGYKVYQYYFVFPLAD